VLSSAMMEFERLGWWRSLSKCRHGWWARISLRKADYSTEARKTY